MLDKIAGWFLPKFQFNVNVDAVTTYLGLADALIVAALTYAATGGDYHNPVFYLGLAKALQSAYSGYWTNKAPKPAA